MDDAPRHYAHLHVRYSHAGKQAALAGHCGQFVDEISEDERTAYLRDALETAKQASTECYPGSLTEISGNAHEGYIIRDTWTGSCGHEHVAEAQLFINQARCDPRAVQAEHDLLARLAAD